MTQLTTVRQKLERHGLTDGIKQEVSICRCDHQLQGTGAVFYQSLEMLYCSNCLGWQLIRKPIE